MNTSAFTRHFQASRLTALALAALSACGGGADVASVEPELAPSYHLAPVQPTEPGDTDADGLEASAHSAPLRLTVSGRAAALSTARRVPADLQTALSDTAASGPTVGALAAARVATVYTPAQIRAAYGFAQLPAATAANKGVYQGSGQTIYIIDAYHNPNIANDLTVFNQKFGLPTCSSMSLPATTRLPLPATAAGSGCSLVVAYAAAAGSTPIGVLSAKAPAVNKGWVTESSLDVQWTHAIAPMARIVLIEAASSLVSDLMAAVDLANKMGPGVVSMSFGAQEFNYSSMQYWGTPLGGSKMSYVASNGDGASQVNWPAVDARVLAVGGTTLQWNGSSRSETVWSSTGGAISTQVPVPAYQAGIRKPGDPSTAGAKIFRGSTDVAFNADPYSGQYVYVTPSNVTGGTGWISAGGTSIAAPQWAGLVSIGNAVRAASSKAPLGLLQTSLYTAIAKTASVYATTLSDIKTGSNGSCGAMCNAGASYDLPTGLGTPNTAPLVQFLAAY
jgi:subtilase family serine protease